MLQYINGLYELTKSEFYFQFSTNNDRKELVRIINYLYKHIQYDKIYFLTYTIPFKYVDKLNIRDVITRKKINVDFSRFFDSLESDLKIELARLNIPYIITMDKQSNTKQQLLHIHLCVFINKENVDNFNLWKDNCQKGKVSTR